MTREQFARTFRWDKIMWVMGFVNVVALLPQPVAIVRTHNVSGISVGMFVLFILVQASVATESFIKRSYGLMCSMIVSVLLSMTTIGLVLYYR
ncbi:MAG TPA: PQ-loop domain-containing transporter [Candidatus Paceibacterota bacterium]